MSLKIEVYITFYQQTSQLTSLVANTTTSIIQYAIYNLKLKTVHISMSIDMFVVCYCDNSLVFSKVSMLESQDFIETKIKPLIKLR